MLKEVLVKKLHPDAKLPERANWTDAGLDLFALDDTFIPTGQTAKIKTGISLRIPQGYVGEIKDRSSMASKGLSIGGGVVDALYSGDITVVIHNLNNIADSRYVNPGYYISKGDKIAQLLIRKVETPDLVVVNKSWESDRGSNSFGSSGT